MDQRFVRRPVLPPSTLLIAAALIAPAAAAQTGSKTEFGSPDRVTEQSIACL